MPIHEAFDGEEAVQYFKESSIKNATCEDEHLPTVVFLDMNMPRINGFEFLDEFVKLREKVKQYKSIIFLMVKSSENPQDKERASQYDFVKGYINKMPTTSEELLTQISEYLPD